MICTCLYRDRINDEPDSKEPMLLALDPFCPGMDLHRKHLDIPLTDDSPRRKYPHNYE